MQRRTRIWIGLGAAVLVSGTTVGRAALADGFAPAPGEPAGSAGLWPQPPAAGPERLYAAQTASVEAGEGGPGEGGGQVLGTITEFRLGSTDPAAYQYDAATQVAAYAGLVYDAYVAARDGALALQGAIEALLADPTEETLAAARQAWVDARPAYLRTEAFQFYAGPVDAPPSGPLPRLNAWPIDPGFVEGVIADPSVSLNFRSLARLNKAGGEDKVTTGWHVIELLLWGEGGGRAPGDFAPDAANERRRDYLGAVAQLLVNDLGVLVAAWAPDANNYRAAVEAMDQRNAIGRAFNGMTVLAGYEIPLRRIGAGLFPANANFQQSPFSDTSAADNRFALEGARNVYYGSGFDALLRGIDPDLAAQVDAAFDRAAAAVAALDEPYSRFLAPPAGSPERAAGEEAVRALTDLGRELRQAGNRLGVLVVVPGL
jgi:putative iron-regulated protein